MSIRAFVFVFGRGITMHYLPDGWLSWRFQNFPILEFVPDLPRSSVCISRYLNHLGNPCWLKERTENALITNSTQHLFKKCEIVLCMVMYCYTEDRRCESWRLKFCKKILLLLIKHSNLCGICSYKRRLIIYKCWFLQGNSTLCIFFILK